MKRPYTPLIVLAATLCLPAVLVAQSCRGIPFAGARFAVSGERGGALEGGGRWGGRATYRVAKGVALSGGYARTSYGDPMTSVTTSLGSSLAYQRTVAGASDGVRLSICPIAGLRWERYSQLDLLSLPVGLAAGLTVPLSRGWRALLHVEPGAVYTHGEVAGLSSSGLSPGVGGGAAMAYGRFYLGATHRWVQGARADRAFTLHAGVGIGGGGDR